MPTTAEKLLAAARASNPGATYGTATYKHVIVTYERPSKTYDVGTAAMSHATGKRSAVLAALEALLAGAVVPVAAAAPVGQLGAGVLATITTEAAREGKRLPGGAVRVNL